MANLLLRPGGEKLQTTSTPYLAAPTTAVRVSFLKAMAEFEAEGRFAADHDSMISRERSRYGASWADEVGFAAYVQSLHDDADPEKSRASHLVPSTTLWWMDGDEYLGRLAIRHRLNERLLEIGGHIGYDVRPSARLRGHATAMLRDSLPHAKALGIDPALLTCDTDNVGSRKVIERNGGAFEDERQGKLRYWVPTSA
jgi:predicted acetyltransferase